MPARQARRLAALVVAATLVGACGDGPSATPPASAADPLEVYRAIAAEIVEIRGLEAPDRADPQLIDPEQLRENYEAAFDESNPDELLEVSERVYRALGLLAEDASLREIFLELNGSQVIGYYDTEADELFIVSRSGALGPTERVTYAHEFTHELQDEAFDLESLGLEDLGDDGDRALAILSLVEGDATSAQTTWMLGNLSPDDLAQIAAEASDPELLAILARTPAILLETSLFPYQAGATFVAAIMAGGGYDAVDAAYDDPPQSTEQILHPETYLAGEAPVAVDLPADLAARFGPAWTLDAEDTLGELQLRVWLREGGVDGPLARAAAEGWGGDRLALLRALPGGSDLIVLMTEWDTAGDAGEFTAAAREAVDGLQLDAEIVAAGRRVTIAIGTAGPLGPDVRDVVRDLGRS